MAAKKATTPTKETLEIDPLNISKADLLDAYVSKNAQHREALDGKLEAESKLFAAQKKVAILERDLERTRADYAASRDRAARNYEREVAERERVIALQDEKSRRQRNDEKLRHRQAGWAAVGVIVTVILTSYANFAFFIL